MTLQDARERGYRVGWHAARRYFTVYELGDADPLVDTGWLSPEVALDWLGAALRSLDGPNPNEYQDREEAE
jgi:hypothetical protein